MRFVAIQKERRLAAKPVRHYRALHAAADRLAPRIERLFVAALGELRRKVSLQEILNLLLSGRSAAVADHLPWDELANSPAVKELAASLAQGVAAGGEVASQHLRPVLVSKAAKPAKPAPGDTAAVELTFDARHPNVEAWARERSATLVREVTDESRRAVRQVVTETIETGEDYGKRAQRIKDAVGLTTRQAQAVSNYRDLLTMAPSPRAVTIKVNAYRSGLVSEDTDRAKIDGLADRYRARLETPRSPERVDQLVEAYAERTLKRRAETISRTETIAATTQGQLEYWRQLIGGGIVDGAKARKEWVVTPDDRLCPLCEPMAGVRVGVDESFETDAGTVDGPPLHPNCRCAVSLVPDGKKEEE